MGQHLQVSFFINQPSTLEAFTVLSLQTTSYMTSTQPVFGVCVRWTCKTCCGKKWWAPRLYLLVDTRTENAKQFAFLEICFMGMVDCHPKDPKDALTIPKLSKEQHMVARTPGFSWTPWQIQQIREVLFGFLDEMISYRTHFSLVSPKREPIF